MIAGKIIGIFIARQRGEPTIELAEAHVVPGMGIEGDRYFQAPGAVDTMNRTGREITLVESESIDEMNKDGIHITAAQTRRNLITQGISLNSLVDKIFTIGTIQLHGVRLCEPCDYLASKTDPRVKDAMAHRGGLRADILTEGYIHINDLIVPTKEQA